MTPLDATVIVVSYRPGDWLAPCLESVLPYATQVIVVDNASPTPADPTGTPTGGTQTCATQTGAIRAVGTASAIAERVGAMAIRSPRNLGFAGGVALALPKARGQVIAVLNDDAVADPAWIPSATAILADPDVAAVTPKVVLAGRYREVMLEDEEWFAPGDRRPLGRQLRSVKVAGQEVLARAVGAGLHDFETGPDGSTWRWSRPGRPFYVPLPAAGPPPTGTDVEPTEAGIQIDIDGFTAAPGPTMRVLNHAGSFLRHHGIAGEHGFGAPDDGRFDQAREPFGFSGTAPVFRADTLRRIGGFAPRFFAYNEDTDWCLRARLVGLRIAYDPGATVSHRLSATSGGTAARAVRHLSQRNALLCLARNAPAGLARAEITDRLRKGWTDPVARQLARNLPWAVATRLAMGRHRTRDVEEVWARWSEADSTWDTSPAGDRAQEQGGASDAPTGA